jgi:hypothetical protein
MMPPYGSGMYGQPPGKTSGAAITSLILGILGCIPLITSIGAIIFGLVGISSTRKPGVGGRGLAIAGLVLGIIGILGWTGFGGLLGWGYQQTKPDRVLTKTFMQNLSTGNLAAAQAMCAPSVSPTTLQQSITKVQGYGTMTSFTPFGFNYNQVNASGTAVISGIAVFGPGVTKSVVITLTHSPGTTPLVQSWTIQ